MDFTHHLNQILDNDNHFIYMTNLCVVLLVVIMAIAVTILIVQMRQCHHSRGIHKMVKTNQVLMNRLLQNLAPFSIASAEFRREHAEILEGLEKLQHNSNQLLFLASGTNPPPVSPTVKIRNQAEGGKASNRNNNNLGSIPDFPTVNI